MITAAHGCFLPALSRHSKVWHAEHPSSLLPLYRGAAPVQRCLENGDAVSEVTVGFTVLAMDAGPVLRQVKGPLTATRWRASFCTRCSRWAPRRPRGLAIGLGRQPRRRAHSAGRREGDEGAQGQKDEAEVRLDAMSAQSIHNRCRGFAAWPASGPSRTWAIQGPSLQAHADRASRRGRHADGRRCGDER